QENKSQTINISSRFLLTKTLRGYESQTHQLSMSKTLLEASRFTPDGQQLAHVYVVNYCSPDVSRGH
ncbi:hypothetical protein, partial [Pseudoalteromonas piscicida]|uniref:hypothetical protein n=1 Tax=Pseudoalteromonas piscicida TaxID=43662 RepID=UPI001BB1D39B